MYPPVVQVPPKQDSARPLLGGISGEFFSMEADLGESTFPSAESPAPVVGADGTQDLGARHSLTSGNGEDPSQLPPNVSRKGKSADPPNAAGSGHPHDAALPAGVLPEDIPPANRMPLAADAGSAEPGVTALSSSDPGEVEDRRKGPSTSSQGVDQDDSPRLTASLAFTARLVPLPAQATLSEGDSTNSPDSSDTTPASGGPAMRVSKEPSKSGQQEPGSTDSTPLVPAQPAVTSGLPAPSQAQNVLQKDSTIDSTAPLPPAQPSVAAEPAQRPGGTEGPASPARDIQLQLNQGEQRVDVRLSERSGEVRVAVRTPDPQLAGALRNDLPELSARLEQTGFRTETWHPALSETPSGLERRLPATETSFSNPQGGGQSQPRQDGQQQQPPRPPKPNGAPAAKDPQRKEFQWLMSQLP
jgi:hypothetical protein